MACAFCAVMDEGTVTTNRRDSTDDALLKHTPRRLEHSPHGQ